MDIVTLYNPLGLETTVPPVAASTSTGSTNDVSTRSRRPPGPLPQQPFMQGVQQAFTSIGVTTSDSQSAVIHDLFAAMASETSQPQDVISALHQMIAELSSGKGSRDSALVQLQRDFAALTSESAGGGAASRGATDGVTGAVTDGSAKGTLLAFLRTLEHYAPPMPSSEAAVGGQINAMA